MAHHIALDLAVRQTQLHSGSPFTASCTLHYVLTISTIYAKYVVSDGFLMLAGLTNTCSNWAMLAPAHTLCEFATVDQPKYNITASRENAQSYPQGHASRTMNAADKIQEFVTKVIRARHDIENHTRDFSAFGKAYITVSSLDREIRTWYEGLKSEMRQLDLIAPAAAFLIE
jgi:hypothetical protein